MAPTVQNVGLKCRLGRNNNREMAGNCPVKRSIFTKCPAFVGNHVGSVPPKRRRTYGQRFVLLFSSRKLSSSYVASCFCLFLRLPDFICYLCKHCEDNAGRLFWDRIHGRKTYLFVNRDLYQKKTFSI
ncbi:hypothetical protein CEXT_72911 [Caerostris extrusa]|uniref:Uncharacterized protein n=1 Tax=Caerostris extrusa TaxID=172846 RepID=A0AAV4R6F5_CAEEX|nr:hypothetical protein CEXT_72911 [Caerostris extrusa]